MPTKAGEDRLLCIQKGHRLRQNIERHKSKKWIINNVREVVALAAYFGNTHIRAMADVDNKACLEGVKDLIMAREEFKEIVDIQVLTFTQDGIVWELGADELVREAMKLGVDVVGGIPWIEYTEIDMLSMLK